VLERPWVPQCIARKTVADGSARVEGACQAFSHLRPPPPVRSLNVHSDNAFLVLSLVLLAGLGFGGLARRLRLPTVTGQIVAGVLIGPAVLGLIDHAGGARLRPMIDFALALMAVDAGSHLSLRRLRPAKKRLLLLAVFEVTLTPLLVIGAVTLVSDTHWYMAQMLGAIAIATAPGTILSIVKETRSTGTFVKTLVAAVALNNLLCILGFEIAHTVADMAASGETPRLGRLIAAPLQQLGLAVCLSGVIGAALLFVTRNTERKERLTAASMVAIVTLLGVAHEFNISVLLSSLFLGVFLENVTPDKDEIGPAVFANFEPAIYAVFFTIAGTELQFRYLAVAGMVAMVVFTARATGKVGAGYLAMKLAGATRRIRRNIGVALLPQAGLAVGLMLLIMEDPVFATTAALRGERDTFLAVVLAVVLCNEIVGPILARGALVRSGDFERDRARVLDFLHEEHIRCHLRADSIEDAIEQLVDALVSSYSLPLERDAMLAHALERERESSSCLGAGLALPHLRVDTGSAIVGVMGIFPEGVPADTPDGQPLHGIVLFLTPTGEHDHHLAVLQAFARVVGRDETVRNLLYKARSPAHAHEVLHLHERSSWFNQYLDEPVETASPRA
jgi:PTS system fructose-specific IIC component